MGTSNKTKTAWEIIGKKFPSWHSKSANAIKTKMNLLIVLDLHYHPEKYCMSPSKTVDTKINIERTKMEKSIQTLSYLKRKAIGALIN